MVNVLRQVQLEVSKYKTKYIAPEVLASQNPQFKADYLAAIEEYRKTDAYKKNLFYAARRQINALVYEFFENPKFKKRVTKIIETQVLKEIVDGNK